MTSCTAHYLPSAPLATYRGSKRCKVHKNESTKIVIGRTRQRHTKSTCPQDSSRECNRLCTWLHMMQNMVGQTLSKYSQKKEVIHTAGLKVANEDTGSVLTQQRAKACVAERALPIATIAINERNSHIIRKFHAAAILT